MCFDVCTEGWHVCMKTTLIIHILHMCCHATLAAYLAAWIAAWIGDQPNGLTGWGTVTYTPQSDLPCMHLNMFSYDGVAFVHYAIIRPMGYLRVKQVNKRCHTTCLRSGRHCGVVLRSGRHCGVVLRSGRHCGVDHYFDPKPMCQEREIQRAS
jgi:hypothetical protein